MQVLSSQFAIVVVKCICETDIMYKVTNNKIGRLTLSPCH